MDEQKPEGQNVGSNALLGLVAPLEWTAPAKPNGECHYDHVIAETPFGRILITWKSWKNYDSPTIDESPWGGFGVGYDVEDAKAIAEREYQRRVLACLQPNAGAQPRTRRKACASDGAPGYVSFAPLSRALNVRVPTHKKSGMPNMPSNN